MPAPAHSTSPDAPRGTAAGAPPAADRADNRAAPRPRAAATGRKGWRKAWRGDRRAAMSEQTHLYAIALGSNRRHVRHGGPSGVVEAAIAELDRRFDLFDAAPIMLNPASGGAG